MKQASKRERRVGKGRGFSLPDVLVGVLLVGGVSLGVASFATASLKMRGLAEERSEATAYGKARLDILKSLPFRTEAQREEYLETFEDISPSDIDADGYTETYELTAGYGDIPQHPKLKSVVTLVYDAFPHSTEGPDQRKRIMTVKVEILWKNLHQQGKEKSQVFVDFLHPSLERPQ